MTITIPENRTIPLEAKAGGGFRSVGLGSAPAAFTAMVAEDFSGGTLGASKPGWKNSEYSDTHSASAGQSLRLSTIPVEVGSCPPSPAFDRFYAGRQDTPTLVPKGKIIWQRIACFFPTTFSFGYLYESGHSGDISEADSCGISQVDGNSTGTKFLVFAPDVTTARTYYYTQAKRRDINQDAGAFARITAEASSSALTGFTDPFPRNTWVYPQMAMKVADDNTGWVRIWINDTLITELLNIQTVAASDTGIAEYGIGDYWNGYNFSDGTPGNSDFWIDEVIVATDADGYGAPTGIDAAGNAYIPTSIKAGDL